MNRFFFIRRAAGASVAVDMGILLKIFHASFYFLGFCITSARTCIHQHIPRDQTSCESRFRVMNNNKRSSSCWHSFHHGYMYPSLASIHNYNISTVAHFSERSVCAVVRWNQFYVLPGRVGDSGDVLLISLPSTHIENKFLNRDNVEVYSKSMCFVLVICCWFKKSNGSGSRNCNKRTPREAKRDGRQDMNEKTSIEYWLTWTWKRTSEKTKKKDSELWSCARFLSLLSSLLHLHAACRLLFMTLLVFCCVNMWLRFFQKRFIKK